MKINMYELKMEFLIFALLLFPIVSPSPYISLAVVLIALAALYVLSEKHLKIIDRNEIIHFRKVGWCFLVIIILLLIVQSLFVLDVSRVAMQRSCVLMSQIYISMIFFALISNGVVNLTFVVKSASLFSILFSMYYLLHVLIYGLPSERDSVFAGFSSNYCATVLYLLYPILIYYIQKNRNNASSKKNVKRCYLAILLSFIVILTTGSRTAFGICVYIFGFITLFTKWNQKKVIKIFSLVAVGTVALLFLINRIPTLQDVVVRALRVFTETNVVKGDIRSWIWEVALDTFKGYNPWLGSGSNYFMFFDIYEPAHNFFIEVLLAYGWLGLGLLVLSHIVFVGCIVRKRTRTKKVYILAIFGAYLLTAYVQPFFSTSFNCGLTVWMTMGAIALDDTAIIRKGKTECL